MLLVAAAVAAALGGSTAKAADTWTATSNSSDPLVTQSATDDAGKLMFHYDAEQSYDQWNGITWTFQATAGAAVNQTYNWDLKGHHDWFDPYLTLTQFVTHNGATTYTTLQDGWTYPFFEYSGSLTITAAAGDTYGFTVYGSNYDWSLHMHGDLVLTPPWWPDTTLPTATITTPVDGATYTLNQSVLADYGCTDSGSGVASCIGDVASGAAIDTSTVGPHSFTVNAVDNAGNTASATSNYTVVYDWTGFFQPVDNAPLMNTAKAGSSIPVKFSLAGNQGMGIFADGYPMSVNVTCDTGEPSGSLEPTGTAGSSGLNYSASGNQYTYVWKTDKAWAGTCRRLDVKLTDGTTHSALFKFAK